jgi:hypothetical protein
MKDDSGHTADEYTENETIKKLIKANKEEVLCSRFNKNCQQQNCCVNELIKQTINLYMVYCIVNVSL